MEGLLGLNHLPVPLVIFQQPHGWGMGVFCNLAMFGQIISWFITNNN